MPIASSRTTLETRIAPPSARSQTRARELHRCAEEVLVFNDGLAGVEADADAEERVVLRGHGALDRDRALDGSRCRRERRHDAVTGVLDLAAAAGVERVADDGVVRADQLLRLRVAEALGERCGGLYIGEQDGAEWRSGRRNGGLRGRRFAHERAGQLALLHVRWVRVLPELRPRNLRRDALNQAGGDDIRIVSQHERWLTHLGQEVAQIHGLQLPDILHADGRVDPAPSGRDE